MFHTCQWTGVGNAGEKVTPARVINLISASCTKGSGGAYALIQAHYFWASCTHVYGGEWAQLSGQANRKVLDWAVECFASSYFIFLLLLNILVGRIMKACSHRLVIDVDLNPNSKLSKNKSSITQITLIDTKPFFVEKFLLNFHPFASRSVYTQKFVSFRSIDLR